MAENADSMNILADSPWATGGRLSDQVLAGTRLLAAKPFQMGPTSSERVHSQPVWLLELFVSGTIDLSVDRGAWENYRPDQGILYAPETPYSERIATKDGVCHSLCVLFQVPRSGAFESWYQLQPTFRRLEDRHEHLRTLIKPLLEPVVGSYVAEVRTRGIFLQLLAHLLEAQGEDITWAVESGTQTDPFHRVHRFMRDRLDQPLSLADVAAIAGLSESGFAHAYKRVTGRTPMATLRDLRVEAVKSHLYHNRLTLAEVAQVTGFADAFHLSRTFKQVTGLSPQRFRQSLHWRRIRKGHHLNEPTR